MKGLNPAAVVREVRPRLARCGSAFHGTSFEILRFPVFACCNQAGMIRRGFGLLLGAAVMALASPPRMSVTAAGGFKVNDTEVPPSAAAAIPVEPGDAISTADVAVVLRVGEAAVVILAPRSAVRTGEKDGSVVLDLTAGSLEYKLTPEARVTLSNRGKPVTGKALQGTISAARSKTLPVVLASGAGAGAVAATVALSRRSKLCPDGTPADHDCGKSGH